MVCSIVLILSIKFYVGPSIVWNWLNKLYVTDIQTADIDEKAIRKETAEDLVMTLAEAKVGFYI